MAQAKSSQESTPFNPWTIALDFSSAMVRDQIQRVEVLRSDLRALETESRERGQRYLKATSALVDDAVEYTAKLANEWQKLVLASFAAVRASAEAPDATRH